MGEAVYTRGYGNFRGVDFSTEASQIDPSRFAYLENMYKDYRSDGGSCIESFPGFLALESVIGHIYGIWQLPGAAGSRGYLIVHAGTSLQAFKFEEGAEAEFGVNLAVGNLMPKKECEAYLANGKLHILTGSDILSVYIGSVDVLGVIRETVSSTSASASAYVPLTFIDGEPYEQRNMLTVKFRERYNITETAATVDLTLHERCQNISRVYINGAGAAQTEYKPAYAKDGAVYTDADGVEIHMFSGTLYFTGVFTGTELENGYEIYNGVTRSIKYLPGDAVGEFTPNYLMQSIVGAYETGNTSGIAGRIDTVTVENVVVGDVVEVYGEAVSSYFSPVASAALDFFKGNTSYTGTAENAIKKCTIATTFDGRIFLTGNPDLPNTVFYSQRDLTGYNNPLYFGSYNYWNDGSGTVPNTALLATPDTLMVMKSNTVTDGSIFYHGGADNASTDTIYANLVPRIYPSAQGVPGLGCLGASCLFRDDPVFISENGLEAVGKQAVNLERTVQHRSSNVDAKLRNETLTGAKMVEWEGYLVLLTPNGNIYLADSRQFYSDGHGGAEYEWYFLTGFGTYAGDKPRYYTLETLPQELAETTVEIEGNNVQLQAFGKVEAVEDDEDVLSDAEGEDLPTFYYIIRNGKPYAVDTFGERTGGTFKPATCLLTVDTLLLFGTENGDICVVNTDKRDSEHRIAGKWYTQNGRAYRCACSLKSDNCGKPNVTKSTERRTSVIKTKSFPACKIDVRFRTDNTPWHEYEGYAVYAGRLDAAEIDFSAFAFRPYADGISPVRDTEKRWTEKQILFTADCFMSPFGIINYSFAYRIAGRIRE